MRTIYCSNCGSDIRVSPTPTNCPNCNYRLQGKKLHAQSDTGNAHHTSPKNKRKVIIFGTPLLIIAAFLLGLYSPKPLGDTSEDFPIALSKSQIVSFLSAANDEDIAEADIDFSDVQAKQIEEESESRPGTYEVTGKFTHDDTTYTFTHEVLLDNGIYYFYNLPDLKEK